MFDELISVIVPVYNVDKFVRQTLDSIVAQTYQNLEILVVDDGSTDNSPAICDEFTSDNRVRVFHRPNCGLSPSRQFGIDNCNGVYFVTVDSDDYVAADYIEKLYCSIKKNDADISVCGVSCFRDGKDGITAVFLPSCRDEKITVTKELLVSDYFRLTDELILTDSWNKMYRTRFVRDTNVKFELGKIYNGTDLQFNHRLALHCPVYCVCRESLLFHRNHAASRIQRKDKPFQEGFEIITESLIKECELTGMPVREQLSEIYYGFIGMVIHDIERFGGNFGVKHKKFKKLVSKNRQFLRSHRNELDKLNGFKTFKVSGRNVSVFMLGSPLFLDASLLWRRLLRKFKRFFKKKH